MQCRGSFYSDGSVVLFILLPYLMICNKLEVHFWVDFANLVVGTTFGLFLCSLYQVDSMEYFFSHRY